MRLHVGPIPTSSDFHPETAGWTALKEPSPLLMQVIATPIGIISAACFAAAWFRLTPLKSSAGDHAVNFSSPHHQAAFALGMIASLLAGFALLVLVHECLHAMVMPGCGLTNRTLIGVWPAKLVFYAHHEGEMSRNRFLLVFMMPLTILTVVPLVIAMIFRVNLPILAGVSILNSLLACGDVLGVILFLFQVPAVAQVRNQGWKTWFVLPDDRRTASIL